MKNIFTIYLLLISSALIAESNYKVTISHPLEIYKNGSIEEALSLSEQWRQKVLLKNPYMVEIDYLLEQQTETRYELLVVYSYKDRASAKLYVTNP